MSDPPAPLNSAPPCGVFIAIEGIDGAGKSSVVSRLRAAPWMSSLDAVFVSKHIEFPGRYPAQHGEALRRLLWQESRDEARDGIPDLHWVHLSASWFVLVDQLIIRPVLAAGGVIVADSWTAKHLARFSLKDDEAVSTALNTALSAVSAPDLTLFLDADPRVAAGRKDAFGYSETGQFDGYRGATRENFIAYQSRVRAAYLAMATPSWRVLDASTTDATQLAEAWVRSALARRPPGALPRPGRGGDTAWDTVSEPAPTPSA